MSFLKNQPSGFYSLFHTILLERFFYFGIRSMFALFVSQQLKIDEFSTKFLTVLLFSYPVLTYVLGGFIGDTLLKNKNVLKISSALLAISGILFAVSAALFNVYFMYAAAVFFLVGEMIFSPNFYKQLINLYEEKPQHHLAGSYLFILFGINLGAFLAPILAGTAFQKMNNVFGFLFLTLSLGIAFHLAKLKFESKDSSQNPQTKKILWIVLGAALLYNTTDSFSSLFQNNLKSTLPSIYQILLDTLPAFLISFFGPFVFFKFYKKKFPLNLALMISITTTLMVSILLLVPEISNEAYEIPVHILLVISEIISFIVVAILFSYIGKLSSAKYRATTIGFWHSFAKLLAIVLAGAFTSNNSAIVFTTAVIGATLTISLVIYFQKFELKSQ